ncbi:MAG: hypothetical protein NE327_01165 [Lentisphaeraceae bacterium]|nr:hypothetical protein [Lentisphaeraceae bacterium]
MTYMIPRKLTDGKASVTLSIKSFGHFYSYAPNYDKAQHAQKDNSQGIYAIYTHTEPYFKPLSSEKQGKKPKNKNTYKPTVNAYEYLQKQMIKELDGALRRKILLKADMPALARAFSCDWYPQKGDSQILKKLIHSADHYALTKEPKELGWFGAGEIAESLRTVYDALEKQSYFDSVIQGSKTRREVYSLFFKKCIEYQTYPFHRGGLTNQDIYINTSVYRCNLLLKKLSPELALSEEKAMDLIYQSIGLKPYRGRHLPNQKARATTSYRSIIGGPLFLSDKVDYFWVSQKGTSKEHGYVSHYGELGYQTATLYELTKDPLVKEQALKMINARAPFRSIQIDQNGRRQVRIESAIGWRHSWYNGKVEYGGIFLKPALVFQDPISIRLAQMFLEDERFLGRLGVHSRKLPLMMDRLEAVKMLENTPPSTYVFPMEDSHPDFAWADEETATIAFKDRGRKAYFSLNWRSAGINNIARFHFTEDQFDRVGNMSISTKYTPSDKTLTRPAEIARNAKGENESLATDGEVLPLAQGPRGGKADFYSLHYGPYFIIMNSSADKQFTVEFPAGTESRSYKDLITGKQIKISNTFRIQPMQTHIFRLED